MPKGDDILEAHVFSINEFNMPKVYTDQTAEAFHIIYLILLDKGKFQSHPDMGVGLRSRYRHVNTDTVLYDLEADIRSQVATYLPDLKLTDVKLKLNNEHELAIGVMVNDHLLLLAYDTESDNIKVGEDANYILEDLF